MKMKTYRIQDYKAAKETLKKYMTNKKDYAFIHYACQSFYEAQQDISPRIAAICVMYANSKQVHLFSLASLAERKNVDLTCCDEKELDVLEKELIQDFYTFMKGQKNIRFWLHWNMRDQNYGFEAIAQRYCRLAQRKKAPIQMDNDKLINMSSLLHQRYGENFADHPRLISLLNVNNIHPKNLLDGAQEAEAFKGKAYLVIDRSVQAKVQSFAEVMDRAGNQELITKGKILRDIYGVSPAGIFTYLRENIVFGAIATLIGGVAVNFIYDLIKRVINH